MSLGFSPISSTPISGLPVSGGSPFTYAASGGITFAGSADTSKLKVYAATGGITFAGTAALAKVKSIIASGGITFSGVAPLSKSKSFITSGGIQFAGAATLSKTKVFTPSGIVQFAGAATTLFTGAHLFSYVASGGVHFGGAATYSKVAAASTTRRSRSKKLVEFTPYREAAVDVVSVSASATCRRVSATGLNGSIEVGVSITPAFASIRIRSINVGGGASASVTPVQSFSDVRPITFSWHGCEIAVSSCFMELSTVVSQEPRTGTSIHLRPGSSMRVDVRSVVARGVLNPTDEELVAMALAARRSYAVALRKRRATYPRQ